MTQRRRRLKKDPVCRYCGKPATRWSGVDVKFVRKDCTIKNLGILYCCDTCNPNGRWFKLGEPVTPEPLVRERRRRRKRRDEEDERNHWD